MEQVIILPVYVDFFYLLLIRILFVSINGYLTMPRGVIFF